MYILCLNHIYPSFVHLAPLGSPLSLLPRHFQPHELYFIYNPLTPVCGAAIGMGVGPDTGEWLSTQGPHS